jgi:hypothetical protein
LSSGLAGCRLVLNLRLRLCFLVFGMPVTDSISFHNLFVDSEINVIERKVNSEEGSS